MNKIFYSLLFLIFILKAGYSQDSGMVQINVKMTNHDLNGDGKKDNIIFQIIDDNGDYSNFLLKINGVKKNGRHSYNVDEYRIVDIDVNDKQKEIAVRTPNANGPEEFIIYRYDGNDIKQIGRTYSATFFNGDGTVDVETYMSFWLKKDRYIYDRDKDELLWEEKKEYEIDIEADVIEGFGVHPVVGSRGIDGMVKKGQKIRVLKAVVKDDCKETGDYSWELCDEFYFVSDDGKEGWITLKELIGKADLPLRP